VLASRLSNAQIKANPPYRQALEKPGEAIWHVAEGRYSRIAVLRTLQLDSRLIVAHVTIAIALASGTWSTN
jgi:hypothetical protein